MCNGKTKSGSPCKWNGPSCPHHDNKLLVVGGQSGKSGGGIFSPITNRIKAIISGTKNGPTGRFTKALQNDRGTAIKSIKLGRKPIVGAAERIMDVVSLGRFSKKKKELGYDEVFHNYLIIELENGKVFKLEKNHVVEQSSLSSSDLAGEMYEIPLRGKRISTYELIHNASSEPNFWKYRAEGDNCQKFTRDLIVKNGLLPEEHDAAIPVPQDARSLVDSLPGGTHLTGAVTDGANKLDQIIHGDGLAKGMPFAKKNSKKKQKISYNPFQ